MPHSDRRAANSPQVTGGLGNDFSSPGGPRENSGGPTGGRRHDPSWGLRMFVGRAGHAQLSQSAAAGVGMKAADPGPAARALYDPLSFREGRSDAVPLAAFPSD